METKFIAPKRKTGEEAFNIGGTAIDLSLADYWSWAYSDLVNNVDRGKLAEFIVASALGISHQVTYTWDKFDLLFMNRGIEVKSSAYLQSWYQEKESYISFTVKPTLGVIDNTSKYESERKRQADIYVFCLLAHKDKLTLDPLDLEQWEFYVVPTSILNILIPTQKFISLNFLQKNKITACGYKEICIRVKQIISEL